MQAALAVLDDTAVFPGKPQLLTVPARRDGQEPFTKVQPGPAAGKQHIPRRGWQLRLRQHRALHVVEPEICPLRAHRREPQPALVRGHADAGAPLRRKQFRLAAHDHQPAVLSAQEAVLLAIVGKGAARPGVNVIYDALGCVARALAVPAHGFRRTGIRPLRRLRGLGRAAGCERQQQQGCGQNQKSFHTVSPKYPAAFRSALLRDVDAQAVLDIFRRLLGALRAGEVGARLLQDDVHGAVVVYGELVRPLNQLAQL